MKKKKMMKAADTADRYALYLRSVQAPDVDVLFFQRVYKSHFRKPARVLREDFCGTAAVCCEWVKGQGDKVAYGVDLDPQPLSWGLKHNVSKITEAQQKRVRLVQGDVRSAVTPKADVVAAQNFSYCIFKSRRELRDYFLAAYKHLADQGLLILDLFGGYESIEDEREDVTKLRNFEYVWEQEKYDPITAYGTYNIHFRFKDGSKLEKAFTYDWRLWTIPEVREVLLEAGFERADCYWEDSAPNGSGTGVFRRKEHGDSDPAWNAYIIGVK